MLNKLIIAATLIAAIAITTTATFAAPPSRPFASTRHAETSGAQWWQDRGNAEEDMGVIYHR